VLGAWLVFLSIYQTVDVGDRTSLRTTYLHDRPGNPDAIVRKGRCRCCASYLDLECG
jgi:hypothetical protein